MSITLKRENAKLFTISEKLITEKVKELAKELPKEVQKFINLELRYMRKHEEELTTADEIDFGNEFARDEKEVKRALSFVLLRHAYKLAEETRGLQDGDLMDSRGKVMPKA